ncbi:MAG: hypothetical protein GXX79_21675 [Actinomycetales bacterium]|nr:hypothetical protein [Actinomycetales bacterium]
MSTVVTRAVAVAVVAGVAAGPSPPSGRASGGVVDGAGEARRGVDRGVRGAATAPACGGTATAPCGEHPATAQARDRATIGPDAVLVRKHSSIRELVAALTREFDELAVRDEWDADQYAVGFARSGRILPLLYVSTWRRPPGRYFVTVETLDVDGDAGRGLVVPASVTVEDCDLPRVAELVRTHLLAERPAGGAVT